MREPGAKDKVKLTSVLSPLNWSIRKLAVLGAFPMYGTIFPFCYSFIYVI